MLSTRVEPDQATDSVYQQVVQQWLSLSGPQATDYYQREVFPRSCQRIRPEADEQPDQLLFVPVGTQPYAPILACLANPSRIVVALHTKESTPYMKIVRESLGSEVGRFEQVQVDAYDGSDVMQKVQSAYDTLGQPDSERVTVDQTGGTKPMTSALAGVAALNGWGLVYIQGKQERSHDGLAHSEKLLRLPNPFQRFAGLNRLVALRLAQQGELAGAGASLRSASEDSVAAGRYQMLLARFRLAQAYREADCRRVVRGARRLAERLWFPLPKSTQAVLAEDPPNFDGLLYWMARSLLAEGKQLSARWVASLLGCKEPDLRGFLKRFRQEKGAACRLAAWKPIDDLLGSGYTRELKRLGSL